MSIYNTLLAQYKNFSNEPPVPPEPVVDKYTPFFVKNLSGEENTLTMKMANRSAPALEIYKSNDGTSWTLFGTTTYAGITLTMQPNEIVYLRCNNGQMGSAWNNYNSIKCSKDYEVAGNIMSLLYGSNFTGEETNFNNKNFCFNGLFYNSTTLKTAERLIMPSTDAGVAGYYRMFLGCRNLEKPPIMTSTTISCGNGAMEEMFSNCSSLVSTPEFSASIKNNSATSFYKIFYGCSNLSVANCSLSATVSMDSSEKGCCESAFENCVKLEKAPQITTINVNSWGLKKRSCYKAFSGCTALNDISRLSVRPGNYGYDFYRMFYNCKSLTNPLNFTYGLSGWYTYYQMYYGCTSLTNFNNTISVAGNYDCYEMFRGCSSLVNGPILTCATLGSNAYYNMFYGCSALSSLTCLATNVSASGCTTNWLKNVSATGTFTKDPNMSDWPTGASGIPEGWTVVDYQG